MKKLFLHTFIICYFFTVSNSLFSEGTKQLMPTISSVGQLCINKFRNDFGIFDASELYRLHIAIADTSEVIRFGFGKLAGNFTSNFVFRLKDPSGSIVIAKQAVPTSGAGYINTYEEAVTGPFPALGGYDYMEYKPETTGNFYMEFDYPFPLNDNDMRLLKFFDITVVNKAENAVNGRLWSKAWQFYCELPNPPPISNRFYGKLMILSDDSVVTQIDCNGLIGGTFSISSNKIGCGNTGNLSYDWKSKQGFYIFPQYKVFLNDPDNKLFPTQVLTSESIQAVSANPICSGGAVFKIKMTKKSTIRILVRKNEPTGAQTEVVQLIHEVIAGENSITWDGKDLNGIPVPNSTPLSYSVSNLSGITHLPLYDIEYNDMGLIVNQIRPAGGQLKIFWDDSYVPGSSVNTTVGCIDPAGCHKWNYESGNNTTINSWWYLTGSEISDKFFTAKKAPGLVAISGNNLHCEGSGSLTFSVAEPSSTSYTWAYSGKGVTMDGTGLTRTLHFTKQSTQGTLSVIGYNDDCGDGPVSPLNIIIEPLSKVAIKSFPDICYTAPGFKLTGGYPEGGVYYVDGKLSDTLSPYKETEGYHSIVYVYTPFTGCSNSDTTQIFLRTGDDCLGAAYFPNAFTPNGDGSNDTFRPVKRDINNFNMQIYNRWGQLIYSTKNAETGWNGIAEGKSCPAGLYMFTTTYGISLRTNQIVTQRGTFLLIR